MNALKIIAIGMAVLLVGAGAAAAAPGNAPTGTPADDQPDNESASDNQSDAPDHPGAVVDDAGPPTNLPSQVPDFVGDIHDAIRNFMDGTIDNLGDTISNITPDDGDDSDDQASNTTTTTTA